MPSLWCVLYTLAHIPLLRIIHIALTTCRVQRTVLQSTADAQAAEKSKKKGSGGGLDSVLSTIKGPKAVSTVLKSSMDWDVYKEKEGLEEDLQAAAKDGYVVLCKLYSNPPIICRCQLHKWSHLNTNYSLVLV